MNLSIKNPYSYLTAVPRGRLSSATRHLHERGLLKGAVLDFGCGMGDEVNLLRQYGVRVTGYDPHYAPAFPQEQFHTIYCNYVLHTLLPEEQEQVLMEVSRLLLPNGKAYFAVPRDIRKEGFRADRTLRLPIYQCRVQLPYASLFRSERYEVYEYWPYTWLHRGNEAVSPFLAGEALQPLIVENTMAVAIEHPDPQARGHALILPKRVVAQYFDLEMAEQMACWTMVNKVKSIIEARYQPHHFSIIIETKKVLRHAVIELLPHYLSAV